MSLPPRNEQQQAFLRQAGILRKNLQAWDATLHSVHGEDWPSMLGRLNAAFVSSVFYIDLYTLLMHDILYVMMHTYMYFHGENLIF